MRNFQNEFGHGTLAQAKLLWDQYSDSNPIFDEKGKPVKTRMPIDRWLSGEPEGTGTVLANEPPQINNREELASLPPGTEYMAPDGTVRRKR